MTGLVRKGMRWRSETREALRLNAHLPAQALARLDPSLVQRCPHLLSEPRLWQSHAAEALEAFALQELCIQRKTDVEAAYLGRLLADWAALGGREPPLGEDLLPELHSDVMNSSLWQSLRQTSSLASQLVSKALPQRCQRRQYAELVHSVLRSASAEPRQSFLELAACSLLGNYRHATTRVRDRTLRLQIYACVGRGPLARNAGASEWLRKLLDEVPSLLAFATREYLVYVLKDNPVLRRHCNIMFDVTQFEHVVVGCMEQVRALVARHLAAHPQAAPTVAQTAARTVPTAAPRAPPQPRRQRTAAGPSHSTPLAPRATAAAGSLTPFAELVQALAEPLAQAHTQHLEVCYPRQRPPFICEVRSARVDVTLPEVSDEVSAALGDLVARIDPLTSDADAAQLLIEALVALGGAPAAQTRLRALRLRYDVHRVGKRFFRSEVNAVAQQFPLTLAVLRLGARLWRLQADTQLLRLPRHMQMAQARGLAALLQTPAATAAGAPLLVPSETAHVVFCHVCGVVYSIVHRPLTAVKHTYRFGLRDTRVDMMADGVVAYCTDNKRVGHMRCGEQPLVQLPLLGQLFVFHKELLFVCCGPRCGAIAKLCPQRCVYTADGYLCIGCSRRSRAQWLARFVEERLGWALPRGRVRANPAAASSGGSGDAHTTLECALCTGRHARVEAKGVNELHAALNTFGGTPPALAPRLAQQLPLAEVRRLAPLFVYPTGLLLCAKHHHASLAECVSVRTNVFSTRDEVLAVVREWHKQRRQFLDVIFHKRDRALLSAMRLATRGHGGGGGSFAYMAQRH